MGSRMVLADQLTFLSRSVGSNECIPLAARSDERPRREGIFGSEVDVEFLDFVMRESTASTPTNWEREAVVLGVLGQIRWLLAASGMPGLDLATAGSENARVPSEILELPDHDSEAFVKMVSQRSALIPRSGARKRRAR